MPRRCPVCDDVLLTLLFGELQRCEQCGHYVDPEGAIISGPDGRLRLALEQAGDEPRMVAELEGFLAQLGPVSPDELRELCERHRRRVRSKIDAMELPEGVELDRVEPTQGAYREPGSPGLVGLTLKKPKKGRSEGVRATAGCALAMAGFVGIWSCGLVVLGGASASKPVLTLMFGALIVGVLALFSTSKGGRPIRQIAREDGRAEAELTLMGRRGDRVLRVPVALCRLETTYLSGDVGSRTHVRFRGPKLDELMLVVLGDAWAGRQAVIRIEDAFGFSGPALAKKKR